METKVILPVLDTEALQKKANEYAQKGAEEALKEFYTGYNSPYRKAIEESLKTKGVDNAIEIPDIIGHLNESISTEIDMIANNAVSKTFIPMVKRFLTRADAEMNLSDILKEFISATDFSHEDDDMDDYFMEIKKDDGSFLYLTIQNSKVTYEVHFYLKSKKEDPKKVYEIYTLPYITEHGSNSSSRYGSIQKTMKLSMDGTILELPFTPRVLEDKFISFIARLVIANTKVTFDVTEFNEDMFPEQDECHC